MSHKDKRDRNIDDRSVIDGDMGGKNIGIGPAGEWAATGSAGLDMWVTEDHKDVVGLRFRVERALYSEQSPHQRVDVVKTAGHGNMLLNDGMIMLSERDEFIYHEMIAHVPLFVHPRPERVLIIGGGDGGAAREVLRHPSVRRCVMVEIDAAVVEAARRHLPGLARSLDDPRLELRIGDGVRYVAETDETFDVAIVDSTDPVGPAAPLFDRAFYGNVARRLSEKGILVTQAESPVYDSDLQRPMLANQRPFFKTLRLYLFPTLTYPGGLWSFAFAGNGICPIADFDADRVAAAGMDLKYYNAAVHVGAFALPNFIQASLRGLIDPPPPAKTAGAPGTARPLRRADKAITDPGALMAILDEALVCHLAMTDGQWPYVVPICFGYRDGTVYFHSAAEGMKIDLLRANPRICFTAEVDARPLPGAGPCDWSMAYRSVVGFGVAEPITDPAEKREALGIIMAHYAAEAFVFPDKAVGHAAVFRARIDRITGKISGRPIHRA